ncbi:MAG TPA: hopanoid-associated sugar epimerase [Pseudolabrys sp.]|jgi:dihydroflavonol-4-reductase|nr:hopanoid-associated sugar epimerase [Pseudolabrys sp.]
MAIDGLVLLTGASGFVGSAVARRLRAAGFPVRALVRATSPTAHLSDLGLDFVTGDLRDAEAVRRAMVGARHLFHVAADYRMWARNPDEMTQTNVAGTRLLMEEAMRAGVERVVYTSSVATLAARTDGVSADETMPLTEDKAIGVYKRSKVAAERAVEALIAQGLPAVIVNPSTPIGPRDVKPTPTGRIIVEAASGRMPAFVDTGLNMVHVDDVAEGHVLAFERGRIGERYVLGGQNASLAEILATVAETVGRRPPRIRIPRKALMPFAHVSEAVARVTGREPMLTLDGLRMSKNKMFFSSAKAERELGYRARPYRAGITDAVAWFRSAGYLR